MIAAASVVLLLAVVALTLLARYFLTLAGRRVGENVAGTLHALEEVVEQATVPAGWVVELDRRMPGARAGTPRQREAAKRYLLRRLAGLRRFCTRSTVIDGPETLAVLLAGIGRAEREWRGKEVAAILEPTDRGGTEG